MNNCIEIVFETEKQPVAAGIVSKRKTVETEFFGAPNERTIYRGDYTVTPSEDTQTLETQGLLMSANVVIYPIPQNYGLITQIGSMIRIS